jgi:hypothetical protein
VKSEIDLVNSRIANLDFLFAHGGFSIVQYEASLESELRVKLLEIFNAIDLGQNHFKKLRGVLGAAYRSARQSLGTPESLKSSWLAIARNVEDETENQAHYLDKAQLALLSEFQLIAGGLSESETCALATQLEALGNENDFVLIPEQKNLTSSYREWVESVGLGSSISVQSSIQDYLRQADFSRSLVLSAAPRTLSAANLRTLIFGGISPDVRFVAPNWWIGDSAKAISNLFHEHRDSQVFRVAVAGPAYLYPNHEVIVEPTFEDIYEVSLTGVESFETGGSIPCRLLFLSEDLALPVEEDADKVSTLIQLEDGTFKVKRVDPFGELEVGDTIFELSSSAESDFLWNLAAEQLGADFLTFNSLRIMWLTKLRDLKRELGWLGIQKRLLDAGVTTAPNLLDWLNDPKFTRPRQTTDFIALLNFVGLTDEELGETLRVTKLFRSKLSSLGQKARESMAEVVTQDEWAEIQAGNVRMVKLDDFGDAEFQLALYKGTSPDVKMCSASQIRRVVRLNGNG